MRLKKWLTNLCLVIGSLIFIVVALEIILRFTGYAELIKKDRYVKNYYVMDPVKGFDIRPRVKPLRTSVDNRHLEYDIWSNELGCFDEPYRGEKQVILLVGDSFTHSYAPFAAKWGTRLENLLGYRVLKCGVNGYGTRQELLKAQDIIGRTHTSPRLIIVGYFWNDLDDDYYFPNLTVVDGILVPSARYQDKQTGKIDFARLGRKFSFWDRFGQDYPLSFRDLTRYFLDQHLITVNLINEALLRFFPPDYAYGSPGQFLAFNDAPWAPAAWKVHEDSLKGFQQLAAANHARLLVVIIPTNTQVYPFLAPQAKDLDRPNRILTEFLGQAKIDYLDLLPYFRKYADLTPRRQLDSDRDLYWRYNSHWSLKGEELAGLLVSRYILAHDLVAVPDREQKLASVEEKLAAFH